MRPLKNKVSITLDNDVVTAIKKLAENDDRSFSQYINMILREHVAMSETAATSANAAAVANAAIVTMPLLLQILSQPQIQQQSQRLPQ